MRKHIGAQGFATRMHPVAYRVLIFADAAMFPLMDRWISVFPIAPFAEQQTSPARSAGRRKL
jgi:hypothetical protein